MDGFKWRRGGLGRAAGMTAAAVVLVGSGGVASTAAARPLHIDLGWVGHLPPTTAQCLVHNGVACYSPQQFQRAYDMQPLYNRGLTGAGRTIVIVDSFGSPTVAADLAQFDSDFGLPAPPSLKVIAPAGPVPPFDPTDGDMVGWAEETSLDVQYAHAMAPGANILLVETPVSETEGTVGFPEIVQAETYVIDHNLGDVITQSFGATEQTFPSPQSLLALRGAFTDALSHQVTVLGSSGDAGPTDYESDLNHLFPYRVNSWPSTDPLVTSVGGTQLHLDATGVRTAPDNVWNDTEILGGPAASGGGVSSIFARPLWQFGLQRTVGSQRGTPDISMTAAVDGAALVYTGFGGARVGYHLIGGTSEASPMFSGVVAIADQAAGHRLGLLNPSLYLLGGLRAPGIPDVTAGNNTVTFDQDGQTITVQGFDAVRGYDLATGLGTVDGAKLVSELAVFP
jgi:subtilase family serine protease